MTKKNQLSKVSIDRVDLVDRPANPGARIAMFKRHVVDLAKHIKEEGGKFVVYSEDMSKKLGSYGTKAEAEARLRQIEHFKRDFSQDERDKAADTGAAMPDGSFPIKNTGDLTNAIRLAGNAKDPDAARRHIIARAKALGASDKIPDTWVKKSDDGIDAIAAALLKNYPEMTSPPVDLGDPAGHVHAVDDLSEPAQTFDDVVANDDAEEYSRQLLCDIDEATCRLRESVCSIMCDDEVTDKQKMLEETFQQFHQHLQDLASEDLQKALGQAMAANKGDDTMTPEELKKAIATEVAKQATEKDADIAKLKEEVVKKDAELAFAKMSDEHKKAASDMSDEDKAKFMAMSADERDAHLKKRAAPELPADVKKKLDEFEDIKKKQAEYETEREVVSFGKRAVGLGLVEADGEILRKAYKGDKDAIAKLEEKLKGLTEQVNKGDLFKEFGTNQGGNVTGGAMAQLTAKRDELMKSDPKLTSEQAFSKVYADPANKELVALEKRERLSKAA